MWTVRLENLKNVIARSQQQYADLLRQRNKLQNMKLALQESSLSLEQRRADLELERSEREMEDVIAEK